MKANSLCAALLSSALAVVTIAGATSAPANAAPQVSMTRSMVVFAGLERELAGASSGHDQAATDRLLSPDFELRPDAHPGEPTTRADWLADGAMRGSGTDEISVRDLGDVAIASFIMKTPNSTSRYVIDVWKKQGNDWQLLTRYQSALPASDAPTEDKAPTGKG